jgi:hypothetical protein
MLMGDGNAGRIKEFQLPQTEPIITVHSTADPVALHLQVAEC